MTGTVAALGFVPMMLSTGIGAEVQRPLATVVFFGMICDTFLTMLALPILYLLFGKGLEVENVALREISSDRNSSVAVSRPLDGCDLPGAGSNDPLARSRKEARPCDDQS